MSMAAIGVAAATTAITVGGTMLASELSKPGSPSGGGGGALNQKGANRLINSYENRVNSAMGQYTGSIAEAGSALTGSTLAALGDFNRTSGRALTNYGNTSAYAIDDFANRSRAGVGDFTAQARGDVGGFLTRANSGVDSFLGEFNTLWDNPVGRAMLPAVDQALTNNEQNLGRYSDIAGQLSMGDQDTRLAMLDRAAPSWRDERDQAARVNASLLKGEIPPDVRQALARSGAEGALQGGFGGSGAARNMMARDLGITSLDLTQQGQGNAQSWQDLLYRIAVPQQTTGAQMMEFSGLSGRDAATGALRGLDAQGNALTDATRMRLGAEETALGANLRIGETALAASNRTEEALMGGRLLQQNNILNTQMDRSTTNLATNVGLAGSIFGSNTTAAENIFSTQVSTAENATNARLGLGVRAADDAQAASNLRAQQASQLANTVTAGVGTIAGAYANRSTGTATIAGGKFNPNAPVMRPTGAAPYTG